MFFLYGSLTLFLIYSFYKTVKYIFFPNLKSFEDVYAGKDEYIFLCCKIKYEDDSENNFTDEITYEELIELNENNLIKYIIIDYMYNNKYMRYINYDMNIDFPIYDVDINQSIGGETIENIYLNNVEVTSYITPFLGPKNNFYLDKNVKIVLKDLFKECPKFSELDFKDGKIDIITKSGKKLSYDLPWTPVWKQFSGDLDLTKEINFIINNNDSNSEFGFTVIDKNIK